MAAQAAQGFAQIAGAVITSDKYRDIKTGLYTAAGIFIFAGLQQFQSGHDPISQVLGLASVAVGALCFWVAQRTHPPGGGPQFVGQLGGNGNGGATHR